MGTESPRGGDRAPKAVTEPRKQGMAGERRAGPLEPRRPGERPQGHVPKCPLRPWGPHRGADRQTDTRTALPGVRALQSRSQSCSPVGPVCAGRAGLRPVPECGGSFPHPTAARVQHSQKSLPGRSPPAESLSHKSVPSASRILPQKSS